MAVAQSTVKAQVIDMLNNALQLEHAARIQYLAHAELVSGINAEPVIARLREIASDEEKHEAIFRELLGDYLDAEPTMAVAETHKASTTDQILGVNLKDEKTAIEFYKQIYNLICENKKEFPFNFEALEHKLRHIIIDEQEHVSELSTLIGRSAF